MNFSVYIDILTIVLTVVIGTVIPALLLLRRSRYDSKENKAILESMRNTFEQQMYILNDRLIQSEERWRDVNHLLLSNKYVMNESLLINKDTHYSSFLEANGIQENDLIIDEELVFILTPFHDKYYKDYLAIKEACLESGYNGIRGDETEIRGDIFPEMLKLIVKSAIIIASVNGRNPNVMYELGIAQALDKTVILVSSTPDELPIDIQSKKFLIYKSESELKKRLKEDLKSIRIKNE